LPVALGRERMPAMKYRRRHDRHRPRGWLSLFIRLGGWVSFILGVALFVLTLFSAGYLAVADKVDRLGDYALGTVVEKSQHESELVSDLTTYWMTFAYKTSDGGKVAKTVVAAEFFNETEIGDERVVRYLRAEPGRIVFDRSTFRETGVILRWVGLAMGIGGLWALWYFGSRANRAVIVRRDGDKRFAEVTGIHEMNVEINSHPQGRLLWREDDGQTGESLMRDRFELSRLYKAGDQIVVFRLGDEAFWEGDVGPPRREARGA